MPRHVFSLAAKGSKRLIRTWSNCESSQVRVGCMLERLKNGIRSDEGCMKSIANYVVIFVKHVQRKGQMMHGKYQVFWDLSYHVNDTEGNRIETRECGTI